VLAIVLSCACVEFRVGLLVAHRWPPQQRKHLAVAFALSIAAVLVNPAGLSQLTYPLNTMFSQPIGIQLSSEWQPAPMNELRLWALFAISAMILLLPLLRRTELRLEEFLLLGLGFGLGVQHRRLFFVFGILVMPSLCRLLATAWDGYDRGRDPIRLNLILITGATVIIALYFPSSRDLSEQARKANPTKALEFMKRSGLSGRMVNEYIYGGYLIWAEPERKVFIDGRADVYEWSGVFADYINWVGLKEDPSILLDKYRIDFCLLSREAPITRVLPLLPGWHTVYSDDMSMIIERRANANGSPKARSLN